MSETKTCNVCNTEKPLSEFYFRKENNCYRPNCKKCKPLIGRKEIAERMAATTKICKDCNVEKPVSEYQKAGGGAWLQPYCKPCDAERKRKHTKENIEVVVAKKKEYYIENRAIIRKKESERYAANPNQMKEYQKWYAKEFPEKVKKLNDKRAERQRQIKKEWLIANKDIIEAQKIKKDAERLIRKRERRNAEQSKKTATDIGYRILKNLRARARFALKRDGAVKSDTTEALLGCTIPFFRTYFESLFTEGMSWEAFMAGEIHVDHKRPCSLYDLTKPEEQRACFNYKNLQPLWKLDNLSKGRKYQELQKAS